MNYAYIKVKLNLSSGLKEEDIQDIVAEMDYHFNHDLITDTEVMGVEDKQIVFYQPKLTDDQWADKDFNGNLMSFEVFATREEAQHYFPDCEILELTSEDVEDYQFANWSTYHLLHDKEFK